MTTINPVPTGDILKVVDIEGRNIPQEFIDSFNYTYRDTHPLKEHMVSASNMLDEWDDENDNDSLYPEGFKEFVEKLKVIQDEHDAGYIRFTF